MKRTKKSLAFVLAVAMMLTMIPASVFAATTNEVVKVVTVAADKDMPTVGIDLRVTNASGIAAGTMQTFRLTLENATWQHGDVQDDVVARDIDIKAYNDNGEVTITPDITVYSDNSLEVTVDMGEKVPKDGYFHIDMKLTAGEEAGEVKVVLEGSDSEISSGTYVVATIAGGDTIGKVVSTPKKVSRGSDQLGATIEIREAAVTSIAGDQTIKLTLPKGFEWDASETDVRGSMVDSSTVTKNVLDADGRDLEISFTANGNNSVRETIVIEPHFDVTRDAKAGDVTVQVRATSGDISDESGLVIATYGDDAVTVSTVKEKDLPTIIAGFERKESGDAYTVKVTLEEVTQDSLIDGKYVEFEFPEWVQVTTGAQIKVKLNGVQHNELANSIVSGGQYSNAKKDTSVIEWTVDDKDFKTTGTNKVEFEIPVTVEAQHSGDLELTVRGPKAGVDETKLVVAKIVAPISLEVELSDLRTGIQSQAGGTIVIKETEVGLIRDDEDLTLSFWDLGFNGMKFDDATVKVTRGDLEINEKKVSVDDGVIIIPVERGSIREAAEITISDVSLNLDRTMPEGGYNIRVRGKAAIDNSQYNDEDFTANAASEKYLNIITPADGKVYGTAKFQLGAKEYSVLINGKEQTYQMDTAAFTQNQRTMIPVKFVAQALGVSEDNVVWNGTAKTATFFKGDRVCVLTAGSNIMNVNGAEVVMDSAAFVKDKRIFVPIKYVANALGCSVEWDGTTKTVTINQ